jgi:hypothetical protein
MSIYECSGRTTRRSCDGCGCGSGATAAELFTGIKVEVAMEVERDIAGVEKERGGLRMVRFFCTWMFWWLVADVSAFACCGFNCLASFHRLRIDDENN